MKKIVLSSVLASTLLIGAEYNYEITPMVGYVDTKSKAALKNHKMYGLGAYRNMDEDCTFDQLELALLHGKDVDYKNGTAWTDTSVFMANAIKEYKINDTFGLYALAGLGYNDVDGEFFGYDSEGFFDYGVGAKLKLAERLALKLDARHMLRFDGSSNILYTLGLAIPFGEKGVKAAPVEAPVTPKAAPKDSDNDGVIDANDKCPNSPAGAKVDSNGCELDSDNDGVVDSKDKCPNSALGVKVDTDGCEIIIKPVDLGIVFDTDSATIKSTDLEKFEKFVAYAKKVPNQSIIIEAHTDDIGSAKYNMGLSHRRAMSAKQQLVNMGIAEDRISAKGYGESKPKVANTSAENRQINRRVEGRIAK